MTAGSAERGALSVRGRVLPWGARTYVMGIVNRRPTRSRATHVPIRRGRRPPATRADGADLIDVGAESTRPGHVPIDAATEIARLAPAVACVRAALPEAIVSIDTFKPEVLRAGGRGGDLLNSIWVSTSRCARPRRNWGRR